MNIYICHCKFETDYPYNPFGHEVEVHVSLQKAKDRLKEMFDADAQCWMDGDDIDLSLKNKYDDIGNPIFEFHNKGKFKCDSIYWIEQSVLYE